jgi:quinol monooxygenase YgiN
MILAILEMTALPAKRQELLQTFRALIQQVRKEKGCVSCSACHDIENKNTFCLIEEWETQPDLDNYFRSDLFSVLLGTKNLMSKPLKIKFNTVSSTANMEAVKTARGESSGSKLR